MPTPDHGLTVEPVTSTAPPDEADPTRNPAAVLAAAFDDWTAWQPGDGTAYRVRVIRITNGPDQADRVLLVNSVGSTIAVQYTDPQISPYRQRPWTGKRWATAGITLSGYEVWHVVRPLLAAAGVTR